MAALVLAEHAVEEVDIAKVLRIALIHDVVEVDAGDTFIYDESATRDQAEREERAARRLFGLLPEDQAAALLALWREFEAGLSAEARYAKAIDRLAAVLLNHASGGQSWRRHQLSKQRILGVNEKISGGSPALWDFVRKLIEDAAARGYIES